MPDVSKRQGEVWEARKDMDGPVSVLTDIYDRTGVPLGPLPIETAAGQALKYGSDGLILTLSLIHIYMELPRRGLITYTWGNVSGIDREKVISPLLGSSILASYTICFSSSSISVPPSIPYAPQQPSQWQAPWHTAS